MTDAVVQVLVEHLFSALLKEGQLFLDFKEHFENMNTQLTYMQSFLTDVEKLKRNGDQNTLKATLIELRELIYDADDILTDCQIRSDYRKDDPSCYSLSPRETVFRYLTGRKLREFNKRIEKMKENLKTYISPMMGNREYNSRAARWTSQAINLDEIIGLKEDTEKIKRWILRKNEALNRVGIVGMGGLGKTTIARKIFNDPQVIEYFDKLIWVSVSQSFSETDIMKSMLKQLGTYESGCDSSSELLNKIHQTLSNKMYLIVFDDIWLRSIEDGWWEQMSTGLPKGAGDGSSIIITTRNEEVARRMRVAETHKPDFLKEEESWKLFNNIAFSASNEKCEHSLVEVGKEIVKKCGGLPLAIKTIGGLLAAKDPILREWTRICNHFHGEISERGRDSSVTVIASLQLSYDELPTHLKSCLLCFSVYPEDCEISAEQLVHWWIAEGFVRRKESRTAIELAFDYLSDLVNRCLVEVVSRRGYDGRVYTCKMHDMVRDLTIQIAREEAFGSFDASGRQKPDAKTRHLSVTSENKMNLQAFKGNSKLRAFLLMTNCALNFNNGGLAKVTTLRALDLSHNKLDDISINALLAWISSQKRLAYLNLRGIANLKELPYSIRKLRNLHILVLTECNDLEKLPQFITTLEKLIILDIGNCPSLQYLPQGLRKLSNLELLSGFKLASPSNEDGCRLGELLSLTQLRILRMEIREEDEITDEELEVLSKLEQLQVLSINTKKCEKKEILQKLDKLSPPPHLQELYLRDYQGETTPNWINPEVLSELQYLYIENGNLKQMSESFWNSTKKWKIEGMSFKFLAGLEVEWEKVENEMPSLKYLEVSHCYNFKSFPCNVHNLGSWRKANKEEIKEGGMESEGCWKKSGK